MCVCVCGVWQQDVFAFVQVNLDYYRYISYLHIVQSKFPLVGHIIIHNVLL